jgi:hypothetical protein
LPELKGTEVATGRYYPVVPVRFDFGTRVVEIGCVLDSGADRTIIPGQLIDEHHPSLDYGDLRLSPENAGGVTGALEIRDCPGSASYLGVTFCTSLLAAPPGVMNDDFPLLGRGDFFTKFVVKFNWNRNPPSFRVDEVKGKRF